MMSFYELLAGYPVIESLGDSSMVVNQITYDSRRARRGSLFVALSGSQSDGHDYLDNTLKQGTRAFLVERPLKDLPQGLRDGCIVARVHDTRDALAYAAARFCGQPANHLDVIAVMGELGKHTLAAMIESVWRGEGRKIAYLNGMEIRTGSHVVYMTRNHPEAPEIQSAFAGLVENEQEFVVLPLTRQDVIKKRGKHSRIRYCILLNGIAELQSDGVSGLDSDIWLINGDDPSGALIQAEKRGTGNRLIRSFGFTEGVHDRAVDPHIEKRAGVLGTAFTYQSMDQEGSPHPEQDVFVGLPGRYNVTNALALLSLAQASGFPVKACIDRLADIVVSGHTEPVRNDCGLDVYIDNAWTAKQLETLLVYLRPYCRGRLLLVQGSGGDRNRQKRRELGQVAGRLSDCVWLTVSNERSEGPEAVVSDLLEGAAGQTARVFGEPDRVKAIRSAVSESRSGDLLLVTGMGAARFQMAAHNSQPYSDRGVLEQALQEKLTQQKGDGTA